MCRQSSEVQGLGNPLTVQALRVLTTQERPNIIFIMETKNQEQKVLKLRRRLRFQNSFIVNPMRTAGGLAIFWDEEVLLTIDSFIEHVIIAHCHLPTSNQRMHISFIHAPNEFNERRMLWEYICRKSYHFHLPWVCIGDFNELLYQWEKVGKKRIENYRIAAFRDFLNHCSLMDMECKGCTYTSSWL